jgi:hypothetical protein
MTSANINCRVIDIDGAQLYADVRSGTGPPLVFTTGEVRGVLGSLCLLVCTPTRLS